MSPNEQAGEPDPYRHSEMELEPTDMASAMQDSAELASPEESGMPVDNDAWSISEANRRLLAALRDYEQYPENTKPLWRRLIAVIVYKATSLHQTKGS